MGTARTPVWRKLLLSISMLVALLLLTEGGARVWLALRSPRDVPPPSLTEQRHCAYDEQLGWMAGKSPILPMFQPMLYGRIGPLTADVTYTWVVVSITAGLRF